MYVPTGDPLGPAGLGRARSRDVDRSPAARGGTVGEREGGPCLGYPKEGNRRMTRLTNAFSKKAENHAYMMAIYFMHYNFVRIHQTLKVTPAMGGRRFKRALGNDQYGESIEDWEASKF